MTPYYRTHRTTRPPVEPRRAVVIILPSPRPGSLIIYIGKTPHQAWYRGSAWQSGSVSAASPLELARLLEGSV